MKLNLGCAKDVKKGWVNVDLYYQHPEVINQDILKLEYPENSVEKIHAQDIIEHLPLQVSLNCLQKWYSWLQKDGELYIQTTNFEKMLQAYQEKVWNIPILNHMLFAGVNYTNVGSQECDFHKSIYTQQFLLENLKGIGYDIVSISEDEVDTQLKINPMSHNLNLMITAKK